jgi:hypothetical protein
MHKQIENTKTLRDTSLFFTDSEIDYEVLDSSQFEYIHGLDENVDRFKSHHSPFDIQDDAQEFYNRAILSR